jgi:hypothetical protein
MWSWGKSEDALRPRIIRLAEALTTVNPQGSKEQLEGDRGLRGAIKKVPADPHPETRIGTSSFQTRLRNRSGLAL